MRFFREYWKALLMGVIALTNGVMAFLSYIGLISNAFTIAITNLCLATLYPIIETWEKISAKNEVVTVKVEGLPQLPQDINIIKTDLAIVKKEIGENKIKNEEKKRENRILVDLMNSNVISIETLDKNILDKKFISVLCYQAGFSVRNGIISQKIKDKIDRLIKLKKKPIEEGIDISREYPKMFEDIEFIKLAGRNEFFIIPEDNLSPNLKDLTKLSDYLIKRGIIIVDEEWKKIKNLHERFDKDFYNQIKDKDNPINFNMLIMKINRRDMRHKFILRNDFNKEFNQELLSIVNLNKFKTLSSEKVTIKNIISQSSLNILILSLDKSVRDKILELEEIFTSPESEGGLGIVNFYDYHTKNIEDIKNILRKKFKKEDRVNEYAKLIYDNSRDYKKDLTELGINF